jgi:hypothetical protein
MLKTYAPGDQTCPGLRGRSDAVQVVGVLQFRAGSPDPAYGGIAAEPCPLHRLVTSGPDVALKRLDLIRQRFGADSKQD